MWDIGRKREASDGWTYAHMGHRAPITALALVGGNVLVTASSDHTLRVTCCVRNQPPGGGGGGGAGGAGGGGDTPRSGGLEFAPAAASTTSDATRAAATAARVDDMLRGVEDAAHELAR